MTKTYTRENGTVRGPLAPCPRCGNIEGRRLLGIAYCGTQCQAAIHCPGCKRKVTVQFEGDDAPTELFDRAMDECERIWPDINKVGSSL